MTPVEIAKRLRKMSGLTRHFDLTIAVRECAEDIEKTLSAPAGKRDEASKCPACERAAGRADGIEAAAKVCAGYGREGDRLSKEYACETADELEARILALLKVPASSPAREGQEIET